MQTFAQNFYLSNSLHITQECNMNQRIKSRLTNVNLCKIWLHYGVISSIFCNFATYCGKKLPQTLIIHETNNQYIACTGTHLLCVPAFL